MASLFCFICCMLVVISHGIVIPTNVTGNTEFYVTSQSINNSAPNYFQNDNIDCSLSICHIICDEIKGCMGLTVDSYKSNTLIIECINNQTCANIIIDADITPNIQIICNFNSTINNNHGTCYNLRLNGRYSTSIDVYCNDYNCYYPYFLINNAISATFNIEGTYALQNGYIYSRYMDNALNVICNGSSSCRDSNIYVYNMKGDVTMTCAGGPSACNGVDVRADDLEGSLTVNCYDGCDNAQIYCSETRNAKCIINCMIADGCWGIDIFTPYQYLYDRDNFGLNCIPSSCSGTNFVRITCEESYGNYAESDISWGSSSTGYRLRCSGGSNTYECCPDIVNNITCVADSDCQVDCGSSSCKGYYIDGTRANSLTLTCDYADYCEGIKVDCPLGDNTSCVINCDSSNSCEYGIFRSQNSGNTLNNFQLNCGPYGCQYMYLLLESYAINDVSIICTGTDSCIRSLINIDSNVDAFTLNCTECDYTDMIIKTVKDVNIKCGVGTGCFQFDAQISMAMDGNIDIYCDPCNNAMFKINGYIDSNGDASNNMTMTCAASGCKYGYVYGYNLDNLDVICNGDNSCENLDIYADSSKHLYLNCDGSFACSYLVTHCPTSNVDACDIYCSSDMQSCYGMDIYAVPQYVYNYLNLTCSPIDVGGVDSLNTCLELQVICDPSAFKMTANYIYNNTFIDYICPNTGTRYCCPYYPINDPKVICNPGEECIVNCTDITCIDTFIDGTEATQLTVHCKDNECFGSIIYCPISGCDISCIGDNACENSYFKYDGILSDNGIMSVNCYGFWSCKETLIVAEYIKEFSIYCQPNGTNSGYYGACTGTELYAQNANKVTITAIGYYAMNLADWYVNNAKTVKFNGIGHYVTFSTKLHAADAESVTISCTSNNGYSSCYNSDWYLPYNAKINCYNDGCRQLDHIFVPTNASGLEVNIFADGICLDGMDYFDSFAISCALAPSTSGTAYYHTEDFQSNNCNYISAGNFDCGCRNLFNNVLLYACNGSVITQQPSMLPTTEPSSAPVEPSEPPTSVPVSPSVSPTKIPTDNPSNIPSASPSKFPTTLPSSNPTSTPHTPGNPSAAPITNEPTTIEPTTDEPTTGNPSGAPITDEPTTAEPTTDEPTTEEPTTGEPTTNEPTQAPSKLPSAVIVTEFQTSEFAQSTEFAEFTSSESVQSTEIFNDSASYKVDLLTLWLFIAFGGAMMF